MLVQIMISTYLITLGTMIVDVGAIKIDMARVIPGIIILSMNSGAYISETVRAGFNAVPKGQVEAAYSLGMRPKAAMRYIILPQAVKNILPSLGNEFITIIKDSSLLQTIGVMELWNGASTTASSSYQALSPFLLAAFYYLVLTSILTLLMKWLENRMNKGEAKV